MFISLTLPAGVSRPGTKYDARGRWYETQLVRWHEKAMKPLGGWDSLIANALADSPAVISDDGGVFTDETADAAENTAADVVLVPASTQVNDAVYFGYIAPFSKLTILVDAAATSTVVAWEYWDGNAWTALSGVTDGTSSFSVTGTKEVTFTVPTDWSTTTVNSQGPYFYVRARVTTAGTGSSTGTQVWITTGNIFLAAPVRGMLPWQSNAQQPHVVMATPCKLYLFTADELFEVTPAGITCGDDNSSISGGTSAYGAGLYGAGPYGGYSGFGTVALTEANTWQLDTFGEDLVAVAYADGTIYIWDLSGGVGTPAQPVTSGSTIYSQTVDADAPVNNRGVVVTPERFIVALAAGGDGRRVQWCDQEDPSVWTPDETNQAGDYFLTTPGEIMAGRRGRNETLIWTTTDLHTMRYIGGDLVYTFHELGADCGTLSRQAMIVVDGKAVWMGQRSFFAYDGFVKPIENEIADYVFTDMNRLQAHKIVCFARAEFGEIHWHYPGGVSKENDRYVIFNYHRGEWAIGKLERTAGSDRGAFPHPLAADSRGNVYRHEFGVDRNDPDGNALTPYAESGPIELGNGDQIMHVLQVIPDARNVFKSGGTSDIIAVSASIFASFYPTATETKYGPFSTTEPTFCRLAGRQVRLRVEGDGDWRVGTFRLAAQAGGLR